MDLKSLIDPGKLPAHVAIIMDGNGRWAKAHGKPRVFGHRNGVRSVRDVSEAAAELGVRHLTLYAFSTENWRRPAQEVNALMRLLVQTIHRERKTLRENRIRLATIGDTAGLPERTALALQEAIAETAGHDRMTLTLALNYSARMEMARAARLLAKEVLDGRLSADAIDEVQISQHLFTSGMPDPELLIRTSGEYRVSNFLLWQIAYAELHFTQVMWPDFRKEHLYQAILDYQNRERRFGRISEQLLTHQD